VDVLDGLDEVRLAQVEVGVVRLLDPHRDEFICSDPRFAHAGFVAVMSAPWVQEDVR
jgi:hypothetical protein